MLRTRQPGDSFRPAGRHVRKTLKKYYNELGVPLDERALLPLPGGCVLGSRPLDFHLKGLAKMGAEIELKGGAVTATAGKLSGATISLEFPSVGATENLMMEAVKRGGNRQELHERIRVHSLEAGRNVKDLGLPNNLIDLIAADPMFGMSREELSAHLEPSRYIGRCPEQVTDFLTDYVQPVLERYADALNAKETALKV